MVLTDVQHENAKIITSTIHIHLDAKNCLKIDVVCESAPDLRRLCRKNDWCRAEFFKFGCL
jgi:metal-responsive CopG/Arc/MetJ family transcriptional regulator